MSNYYNRQWRLPNAWNGTESNVNKQSNYSLKFDSSSSQDISFTTPEPFNGATLNNFDCSFSVWANFNTVNQYGALICFGQFDLEIAPVTSTQVGIWIDNSYLAGVLHTPSLNTWYHYVMTKSGNTYSLYVDGVLIGSGTDSDNATVGSPSFIGSNGGFGAGRAYFDGQIDGVAIFNYALSLSQITTLYGSSSTGIGNPMSLSPAPVAYYPLGDQDSYNGAEYLTPNASLKDFVFSFGGSQDIDTNFTLPASYTSFSYSFWFRWTSSSNPTGNEYLIGNGVSPGNNNQFRGGVKFRSYGGVMNLSIFGGDDTNTDYNVFPFVDATSILDQQWHHISITFVSGEIKTFFDGSLVNTYTNSLVVTGYAANRSYVLGQNGLGSGYLNNTELSNFQIFNTALPATGSNSIETLYNNGSPLTSMSGFTSLQGWWKLDASEIYNSSSTEWDINQATANYTSSLSFPGVVGNLLKIPNSSTFIPTSNLTFSFWVNHTTTTSSRDARIFSVPKNANYEGMYLMDYQDGTMRFTTSSDGNTYNKDTYTAIVVNDGKWHHIVCTFDASGDIKVYTDNGTPNTNNNPGTFTIPASTDMGIGGKFTGTGNFEKFTGLISNGSVWNKALSASEVSEVYNSGQAGNLSSHSASSNLVAWWKMDNLTTGIQDSSTNSNNGTAFDLSVQSGSVSTLNGTSSGMTQANLVQSDLSFTSGYSPYALDFDGVNDYIDIPSSSSLVLGSGDFSISFWIKTADNTANILNPISSQGTGFFGLMIYQGKLRWNDQYNVSNLWVINNTQIMTNDWINVVVIRNSGTFSVFYNNVPQTLTATSDSQNYSGNNGYRIGSGNLGDLDGQLSNMAIWNAALTSSQVTELYNEGVPSNLNNHSAYSNLVSWWQLGSNSSFNTNWTVLDEKGSNNGTSVNMTEADIVDGVGSSANGLSSGMGGDEVIGDAPYSTANSLSVNMDVEDRVSDTPS